MPLWYGKIPMQRHTVESRSLVRYLFGLRKFDNEFHELAGVMLDGIEGSNPARSAST